MSRPVLVARDAHAEPVSVSGTAGPMVITMGPSGSLDLDIGSAISLRDAIDRALTLAAAQQQRPRLRAALVLAHRPAAVEDPLEFAGQPAEGGWYRWTLRGQHGGIDFEVRRHDGGILRAGPIVVHSPVERSDFTPSRQENCSLLGGRCFADAGYSAGNELVARWMASGYDAAVIRTELESWYASRLATPDSEAAS